MNLGALPGLGAVALALAASAPPLTQAPPAAPTPVVSRAPARTVPDAIERARALGAISDGRAAGYDAEWHAAFRAERRLTGPRKALLGQSLAAAARRPLRRQRQPRFLAAGVHVAASALSLPAVPSGWNWSPAGGR